MRDSVFRLPRPVLVVALVAFALVALASVHALTVAWGVRTALDAPGADIASVRAAADAAPTLVADAGGLVLGLLLAAWAGPRLHREADAGEPARRLNVTRA
jgi:hypothetical protein